MDSMHQAIQEFPKQFSRKPKVENANKLTKANSYIVVGMGGSHLAADLLKLLNPNINLAIHSTYGLPNSPILLSSNPLILCSSYSGNTEETLDAYQTSLDKQLPAAAISTGGKLLELAKKHGNPYIKIPNTKIQPRMATGFSLMALLKLTNQDKLSKEATKLSQSLDPKKLEQDGRDLAKELTGFTPVIYSSSRNEAISYNWKIKFNETAKIPAFHNVLPELNHNEMTGFDVQASTVNLSKNFYFVLLKDSSDHPKIVKRMEIVEKLYKNRGLKVTALAMQGVALHSIFNSLLLADWTAYYTAKLYGNNPNQVPMIEEFKQLIAK